MSTFVKRTDRVRVGWISAEAEQGRHSIGVIGNEFTDENWVEFEQICSIVPQFRPLVVDFISAKAEAEKLIAAPDEYGREISKASHPMLIGGKHAVAGLSILQSACTSYLAARSAMIDRALRYLSKMFGKPSHQYNQFVCQTKNEYNENFAYRLYCNLRNYSQHSAMPISDLIISGVNNESGLITLRAKIFISKDKILDYLKREKVQPTFKAELETVPNNQFEIIENTKNDFLSLQRLFLKLCSFHFEQFDEMGRYRDAVMRLVGMHRQKAIEGVPASSTTDEFTPGLFVGDLDLIQKGDGDNLQGKATPRLFGFDELDYLIGVISECNRNLDN